MTEIQIYQARGSPDEAQRARLCLSSSTAVALAESGAPREELAAALGPDERDAIAIVARDLAGQLAVRSPSDRDWEAKDLALNGECMQAITNMRPEMAEENRADWVCSIMADLEREPYELVMEAVRLIRRSCRYPGDFLPNVMGHVVNRKARLQAEAARLEQLRESIA